MAILNEFSLAEIKTFPCAQFTLQFWTINLFMQRGKSRLLKTIVFSKLRHHAKLQLYFHQVLSENLPFTFIRALNLCKVLLKQFLKIKIYAFSFYDFFPHFPVFCRFQIINVIEIISTEMNFCVKDFYCFKLENVFLHFSVAWVSVYHYAKCYRTRAA